MNEKSLTQQALDQVEHEAGRSVTVEATAERLEGSVDIQKGRLSMTAYARKALQGTKELVAGVRGRWTFAVLLAVCLGATSSAQQPQPIPPAEAQRAIDAMQQGIDILRAALLPKVDCVMAPFALSDPGQWTPASCPTACEQTKLELWTRTIVTPPANGGAVCGPLLEQRTSTRTFIPAPVAPTGPPSAAASGHAHGIPNLCANPTILSTQDGLWSTAANWSPSRVPTASDRVAVMHALTIDTLDAAAACLNDYAALAFRTDVSTRLTVGTLTVYPSGRLEIGTPARPVAASVTAELVIADQALDTPVDPEQYGTGLIGVGAVTMAGTGREPFVRLAAEPAAGATVLELEAAPDWRPGDVLVLPDTRVPTATGYLPQWEEVTVAGVSGSTVTLTAPTRFAHAGARDGAGVLSLLPHVGNLTRNVVVRSANPAGTRGHVMLTARSVVDIRGVAFLDLGRTTQAPLNSTTFSSTGAVTAIGTNQIGRYPLHAHHLFGPAPVAGPYQFSLVGNVVAHAPKWGVALHNSHYGLVRGTVAYDVGAGIVTEDGSETGNVIERNFVVRVNGVGNRGDGRGLTDLGWEGTAFWFRGQNNIVRDNVAADVLNDYGFKVFSYQLGTIRIPIGPGADTSVAGQFTSVNANSLPLREFSGNEAYSTDSGGTYWWLSANGTSCLGAQTSVLERFTVWSIRTYGLWHYPSCQVTIDRFTFRGRGNTGTAIQGSDYFAPNWRIVDPDIQGAAVGIVPSESGTPQTITGGVLRNPVNIRVDTLWTAGAEARAIQAREIAISGTTFLAGTSVAMNYSAQPVRNLIVGDTVRLDGIRLCYAQQLSTFVVPSTVISQYNTHWVEGLPVGVAGLTNAQAFAQHGIAIGGFVAPSITARTGITGGGVCP